jgi:hypothetical protein
VLPPGWTIDAYRGGRLFAFDSVGADGRFTLPMPVAYGENVVDMVAYGPHGERVALQEFLRFSPALLARGQSEYEVSVGACALQDCRVAGSVEARAGVMSAMTVRGGLHYESSAGSTLTVPYGSIVALLRPDLGVEIEGDTHGLTRVSSRFEPSPVSGLEAAWFNYPVVASERPHYLSGNRFLRLDAWTALSGRPGLATVRAQLRYVPDPVAPRTELTLGSSHAVGGVHWRPYTTSTWSAGAASTGASGVEVLLPPSARATGWLRGTWFRALTEFDHESSRARRVEATLSRHVSRALRLETEAQWMATRGASLAARIVTHAPTFRGTARAHRTGAVSRDVGWDVGAGGSIAIDARERRVVMSSEPALNRGGLSVAAFLDLNADGQRQPGEPPVPDAVINAGNDVLVTNTDGRAYRWGVPALEPIVVAVDSESVPPHWRVPRARRVVLRNATTTHLELPVVPGSTLEGRVIADGTAASGLELWLIDQKTQERRPVEMFRDGTFYIMSVGPGSYTLLAAMKGDPVSAALQSVRLDVPAVAIDEGRSIRQLAAVTLRVPDHGQRNAPPPPDRPRP